MEKVYKKNFAENDGISLETLASKSRILGIGASLIIDVKVVDDGQVSFVNSPLLVQFFVEMFLLPLQDPRYLQFLRLSFLGQAPKFFQINSKLGVLFLQTRQLFLEPLSSYENLVNEFIRRVGLLLPFLTLLNDVKANAQCRGYQSSLTPKDYRDDQFRKFFPVFAIGQPVEVGRNLVEAFLDSRYSTSHRFGQGSKFFLYVVLRVNHHVRFVLYLWRYVRVHVGPRPLATIESNKLYPSIDGIFHDLSKILQVLFESFSKSRTAVLHVVHRVEDEFRRVPYVAATYPLDNVPYAGNVVLYGSKMSPLWR